MNNVVMVCQECKGETVFANCTAREANKCTANCAQCGALVLMQMLPDGTVHGIDFHKEMNRRNPIWPADGSNTGVIEVSNA